MNRVTSSCPAETPSSSAKQHDSGCEPVGSQQQECEVLEVCFTNSTAEAGFPESVILPSGWSSALGLMSVVRTTGNWL